MHDPLDRFASRGLWALPAWAALLFASTLTHQPDPATAFGDFAEYVTTPTFLASHLVGSIAGAAVGSIGAVALGVHLADTRAASRALWGMLATLTANVLLASIFGIAAFAQPAMGRLFLGGAQDAEAFYTEVYGPPLFATALLGLVLFMLGGVLLGGAVAASGRAPRWAGWVYAVSTVGFALSTFLLPVGQTVTSVALFVATLAIARRAPLEAPST